MAPFSRTLFSMIAALAMLCGMGWTAAAYACPSQPISTSMPADDRCGHATPANHPMTYCGPVCLGLLPAIAAVAPLAPLHPTPYYGSTQRLDGYAYTPEPPPPRGAES